MSDDNPVTMVFALDEHVGGMNAMVRCLSFSKDGTMLASGTQKAVILWDVKETKEISNLSGHQSKVSCLSFRDDGQMLASGSEGGEIILWDVPTGKRVNQLLFVLDFGGNVSVNCLGFSSDGKMLASGGDNRRIPLWDVETGKEIRTLATDEDKIGFVGFSSDGKHFTCGRKFGGRSLLVFNVETGKLKAEYSNSGYTVNAACFSGDGAVIARAASKFEGRKWHNKIVVEYVAGDKLTRNLFCMDEEIHCIQFTTDGKTLAGACRNNKLFLWNVETEELSNELKIQYVLSQGSSRTMCFSDDAKMMATGLDDGLIVLWRIDYDKAKKLADLKAKADAEKKAAGIVVAPAGVPPKIDFDPEKEARNLRMSNGPCSHRAFHRDALWAFPLNYDRVSFLRDKVAVESVYDEFSRRLNGPDHMLKSHKFASRVSGLEELISWTEINDIEDLAQAIMNSYLVLLPQENGIKAKEIVDAIERLNELICETENECCCCFSRTVIVRRHVYFDGSFVKDCRWDNATRSIVFTPTAPTRAEHAARMLRERQGGGGSSLSATLDASASINAAARRDADQAYYSLLSQNDPGRAADYKRAWM